MRFITCRSGTGRIGSESTLVARTYRSAASVERDVATGRGITNVSPWVRAAQIVRVQTRPGPLDHLGERFGPRVFERVELLDRDHGRDGLSVARHANGVPSLAVRSTFAQSRRACAVVI